MNEKMNPNEALRTVLVFILLLVILVWLVRLCDFFLPRNNDAICALALNRKQQLEEMQIRYLQHKIAAYEQDDCDYVPRVMDDSGWLEESYEDLDD